MDHTNVADSIKCYQERASWSLVRISCELGDSLDNGITADPSRCTGPNRIRRVIERVVALIAIASRIGDCARDEVDGNMTQRYN